jgi:NAD(P)-dependent dehydrogenase (short-subunit alcohol dehydrogenase family)
MDNRFTGKVVLVTGGSSGIGFAVAKRLSCEGAQVVITGRDRAKLEKAVKDIGPSAFGIAADISRLEEIDRMYRLLKEKYGRLDGLFANAGISIGEPVETATESALDAQLDTNVKGTFFTLQKAIPLLTPGSAIVVNASATDTKGYPHSIAYAASKAAVRSMARTFSGALIDRGIRVNAVSPGPVETPIWDGTDADQVRAKARANPSKRFGTPEEVAAAVAFLLASESSYIVGVELFVDGGATQL